MNEKYFDISGVYENYTLNGDAVVNADNVTLKISQSTEEYR